MREQLKQTLERRVHIGGFDFLVQKLNEKSKSKPLLLLKCLSPFFAQCWMQMKKLIFLVN